ncbi:MAG: UvrD-helicase domain-containing protein [Defluviitaleaceae bacterium]|nr:UvrD-helicase domain-containing protein [Defluviitaleaceae bacterium]
MSDITKDLNQIQRKAVLHTEGPLLLLSGAGSGKTRVITHRIAYIMEQGTPDYNILAITFTNKAAKEMKTRLESILNGPNSVWISTFHSLCARILRVHIDKLGYGSNFTIYDSTDSQRLLRECIRELNISEKVHSAKSAANKISNLKDGLMSPADYERIATDIKDKTFAKIYDHYQKALFKNNALDFDDIILKTLELFANNPRVLEIYQNRFRYIMVDEYQDTNIAQYTLINMLANLHKNLCVVGDDDQSIYGWRGANIRNILDFEKDFPGTKVIKLEQNYRSTEYILEAANCVIRNNIVRKDKSLWTQKPKGEKVIYVTNLNDIDEGSFVAKTIKDNYTTYSDVAVLYRKNSLSRVMEDHLVRNNVPYKVFGGVRFYDRKEIKDILAYLTVLHNPKDGVAMRRIVNVPKRGIGSVTVDKIAAFAFQSEISFFDALKNSSQLGLKTKKIDDFVSLIEHLLEFKGSISQLITEIIKKTDYEQELGDDPIEHEGRLENIQELINKATEFEESYEDKEQTPTLAAFLEEVSLVADIDTYDKDKGYVSLMTVHSAKGLEFPVVFLVGFEEGIFPGQQSYTNETQLEEERRLCYVAITRAIKVLYLTTAATRLQNGRTIHNMPSRFLREIPEELIENRTVKPIMPVKKGISKFAEIKKFTDEKVPKIIGRNYKPLLPPPKDVTLDFDVGDTVVQGKYGQGTVKEIYPAGKDYEVTIDFNGKIKKFMANFSKIEKV